MTSNGFKCPQEQTNSCIPDKHPLYFVEVHLSTSCLERHEARKATKSRLSQRYASTPFREGFNRDAFERSLIDAEIISVFKL
jgi:hypothetical protein